MPDLQCPCGGPLNYEPPGGAQCEHCFTIFWPESLSGLQRRQRELDAAREFADAIHHDRSQGYLSLRLATTRKLSAYDAAAKENADA